MCVGFGGRLTVAKSHAVPIHVFETDLGGDSSGGCGIVSTI